ncbi:UDP-glycosyltransferase 91A1-like [Cynara cardunculus var. scolymus]|uniref:UDP-glycosyltransferase 91A1-like n=1 Tax=Cynara cardunculus var. scolymus TaxID=59895 RepID=UPI000D62A914|nr:UDP-glycosyltransferase 91A1-like [Cynara cardunculus var. scolymus]
MANDDQLHIAMLPWLAFGHLIPFLQLAKLMATKGHKITFISTPRNIHRLPQIPQTLSPFITFLQIHLPNVDNLPPNAESTKDLPQEKVKYLKMASDGLRLPVTNFLKTSSPDWIIYDFTTYWLGPIAAEHGVLTAYFSVFPAVVLGYLGSPELLINGDYYHEPQEFSNLPKWVSFESHVRPSLFQFTRSNENFNDDEAENVSDAYRLGATIHGCDAVVVRSSFDFEADWLKLLNHLYQKPVIPAGLLPAAGAEENTSWPETREWLEKHEKGSVVYIAFGTETKPNQYELTQIALGLELCGLPFYWVLIDQRGPSDDVAIELPRGYEERTRGRGVVCTRWAPQFKILSHDSVGVLLIHSGMSSVVEGLQLGKPLVLLPFLFDQGLIASYLVEKKMAYMIPRDELDGSFSPESVADSLSLVMGKEEGKIYRDKAREMMTIFGGREIQDKCMDELLSFLNKSLK